jgi:hypothetical protein
MIEINQKRDRNLGLKISSCHVMFIDRNHAGNQKNSSNPSFPHRWAAQRPQQSL